jgi:hypothetical protein
MKIVLAAFLTALAACDCDANRTILGSNDAGVDGGCRVLGRDCPVGTACILEHPSDQVGFCIPGCDPIGYFYSTADYCDAGQKCTYVSNGGSPERMCVDAGTVGEDDPCVQNGEGDNCQEGLVCDPASNTCARFCGAISGCQAGDTCRGTLDETTEFPLI